MTRHALRLLLFALAISLPTGVGAAMRTAEDFANPAQAEEYRALLGELRCLVCQNESLASSDADLAKDLRDEVYRMKIEEGRSNEAVIDFMVDRYGEFVLYEPPVTPMTYLLWGGPLVLLLVGLGVLAVIVRRQATAPEPELTSEERQRVADYLRNAPEEDPKE